MLYRTSCFWRVERGDMAELKSGVTLVLGGQWGDEGKGKLVDILAQEADVVARCQVFYVRATCAVLHTLKWLAVPRHTHTFFSYINSKHPH